MTSLKKHFLLRSDVCYLNFGSFGACARPVFEAYQRFQRELEEEPAQFFFSSGPRYLRQSREALAAYLACSADDLVYMPNPSHAVNLVAKSFALRPGDEVLTTDLEYGACEKTWSYYCKRAGATLRRQSIPLPVRSPAVIADALFSGVSERTRLIFVSHITSTTALVLPVEEICRRAREKGIPCFVDGAHAPGHVPVNLTELGATMYTGACHKWMMAPKGCSFLHVDKAWQARLDPLVVSWGYESANPSHSRFLDYHEGQGTRDYSAFLAVPEAIHFMNDNNWTDVAARCREMVAGNATRFSKLLDAALPAGDPSLLGQMLSIPVRTDQPEALQQELFGRYRIEIPVMRHNDKVYLRYSVNAFNEQADLDKLHGSLERIIKETALIQT